MNMYLQEKIENPDLFTGRRKELAWFSKWIRGIPRGISKSTAEQSLLAGRSRRIRTKSR